MHKLIHGDCLEWLRQTNEKFYVAFADPPDNIGLEYDGFEDKNPDYYPWCALVLTELLRVAPVVWWSFNAIHTVEMGAIVKALGCEYKTCVQTFTFGQNRDNDMGNGHRPLWRLNRPGEMDLFPEAIKVESWRQLNGDKRAAPGGRVPLDVYDFKIFLDLDDVYPFTRVTGNSKQRRPWHKTQLNEGLVERCLKLTSPPNSDVLDPFAGTGTTLRVAKRIGRRCTTIEKSPEYFAKLSAEHPDTEKIVFSAPHPAPVGA